MGSSPWVTAVTKLTGTHVPLYEHTIICLSSHFISEELDSLQFFTIRNKTTIVLYGHMLLFFLGKYLGVEWLDHIIGMYLAEKKFLLSFPKWLSKFKFPVAVYGILTS